MVFSAKHDELRKAIIRRRKGKSIADEVGQSIKGQLKEKVKVK